MDFSLLPPIYNHYSMLLNSLFDFWLCCCFNLFAWLFFSIVRSSGYCNRKDCFSFAHLKAIEKMKGKLINIVNVSDKLYKRKQ